MSFPVQPAPAQLGAFAALRHRDLRLYLPTVFGEGLGREIQSAAILWQIYELTSSPLHLGLIGLAEGIPVLVFSLLGGVIADSVDRRRFIVLTQGLAGLLSLALAALSATGLVEVWHVYLIVGASSILSALVSPARTALVASLVPRHHLLNAFGLERTARKASRLVGPALAGVLIAWLGVGATYGLNGAVYLLTLTALGLIRIGSQISVRGRSPLKSLLEGVSFVRCRTIIMVLVTTDLIVTVIGGYRVLLPVFARQFGVGPEGLGLLLSAPAVGGLVGGGVIIWLQDVRYKGLLMVASILAYCGALVVFAVSPWFSLSLLATAVLGGFDAAQALLRTTVVQTMTPDELRGRVSSLSSLVTQGVPAIGRAQSGLLAALVGAPLALLAGGIAGAIVILSIAVWRRDLRSADL